MAAQSATPVIPSTSLRQFAKRRRVEVGTAAAAAARAGSSSSSSIPGVEDEYYAFKCKWYMGLRFEAAIRHQDADRRYSARNAGQSLCYPRPSSRKHRQGSSIVLQLLAAGCSNTRQPLLIRHRLQLHRRHRHMHMYSRHLIKTGARRAPTWHPRLLAGQTVCCSGTMRLSRTA